MTDELDKLKKAFTEAPGIKPNSEAKKAAINAAMSAFEQEKAKNHQGISDDDRLKERDNKFVDLITFSKWRESMKLRYVLPGVTGLAAIALVAVNTHQFDFLTTQTLPRAKEVITPLAKDALESAPAPASEAELPVVEVPARMAKEAEIRVAETKSFDPSLNPQAAPLAQTNRLEKEPLAKRSGAVADGLSASNTMQLAESTQPLKAKRRSFASSLAAPETFPFPAPVPEYGFEQSNRDKFDPIKNNPLKLTQTDPVSTFSIDVDTASYSFMRASLNQNVLPPKDAVRVEELINYFPYDYTVPDDKQTPFKVSTTLMPTPWNPNTKLLHIGIKGYELLPETKPRSNLVFLLDTSGSMNQPNKLPLLKNAFKLLLSSLSPEDTISIVNYAGSAGTVLEPTKVKDKATILNALTRLDAGGSTAGGEGIRLAYQLAEANFDADGVNRVILATDGDFNIGIRDQNELKSFIERKRDSGVSLSILGFGMGNYNDALMQTLAQNGNGNAAYIDSLSEARKVLVEEASSTLFTIAKDVKIQMEFNPAAISEYRLIGYETRQLQTEDFNNDKVDAGDIGAGHSVTAIYEITPTDSAGKLVDPLRYQSTQETNVTQPQTEYGFLKLRYKLPDENVSQLIQRPIRISDEIKAQETAPESARFATAVAAFGQLLRGGQYTGNFSHDDVIALAQQSRGEDLFGYRSEFINLVRLAKTAEVQR